MTTTNISSCSTFTFIKKVPNDGHVEVKPFEFLCNNKKFADIEFIVGEDNQQQRIFAHKIILSARSAVFEAMFFGTLATECHEIEVPDVEPSAFLTLLKFFYTNEVEICPKTVLAFLYATNKYDVPAFGSLFVESQLATLCLDIINKNTMDVLEAESFTNVDFGTLIFILERDSLQVYESKLFQAIVLWSKAECIRKKLIVKPENQRYVLGRVLTLIRFPLMTLKEFVIGPVQSGLLDGNEITKFCVETALNSKYTEIPRCIKTPIECHLKFDYDRSRKFFPCDQTSFEEKFKFIRPAAVVGFVLHPLIAQYKSNVMLTLKDEKEDTIRCCVSQCNNSFSTHELLHIMPDRPIIIIPDNIYKNSLRMESKGIICGFNGQKLENFNQADYFSFTSCSGIISQIIFYVSEEVNYNLTI